jgi:hypothetical protein
MTLPNLLFIGPDKAGSTWLADVLADHPEVFVPPAKDLYFFDRSYERGLGWYERAFAGARGEPIVAEVCHDYLFSDEARRHIADDLPGVRLLTVVRRPGERAFSSYLHMRKHGHAQVTFEEAVASIDELVDHGRYTTYLTPYVETFGRDHIWVGTFDDLRDDPDRFVAELWAWLGVAPHPLSDELRQPRLAASAPRSAPVARASKAAARATRSLGLAGTVGRVKRSPAVQRTLYRGYGDAKPTADPATLAAIDSSLEDEIRGLADLVGVDVADRWLGAGKET